MKLFYKTNRYGKYSITVSAVESWNKIQKQKICYLEIYPPIKLKQLSVIFIFKSYIDHAKIISDFKACVCYCHQIFIFSPIDSPSKTEKCFLFQLKSSFHSLDIQFVIFLSSPLFLPVGHCFRG